jgi:hypothetical protein
MAVYPLGITVLSSLGLLLYQGLPASPEASGLLGQVERITLTSALILAVGVLWRTLSKKDDQVISSAAATERALLVSAEAVRSLTNTTSELKDALTDLKDAVGRLPCTHDRRN